MQTVEAVYEVPDLAKLLRRSERFVRDLLAEGSVPGRIQFRKSGKLAFAKVVIDKWIADGCPPVKKAEG